MKKKSLKRNAFYNGIRRICSVLFPLITFPYVSRVLGVDALGKYNFSSSIIGYMILIAGLGINTYAIRDGSKIRDDKQKLEKFVSEVFTINIISTVFAYIFLLGLLLIPKISSYSSIILILSIQILFTTIGVEWLYSIFEDYLYITIRSIIFQIISLVLLFLFVHNPNDLIIYAFISTIANTGAYLLNYIRIKKYCNISITKQLNLKKHMKPILILFASQIAVTIYVNSDITLLGLMRDDYIVGIYSVSVKIYTILKNLLSAIIVVAIPRLSYLVGKESKEEFARSGNKIYKSLISLCIPTIVGLILLSKEAILFIGGENYINSQPSLVLLSIAIIFSMVSYFWCQCILVPNKQEKKVLYLTIFSAIINIILNIIMIPSLGEVAAALTTIISEAFVCIIAAIYGRKYLKLEGIASTIIKVTIGCITFTILGLLLKNVIGNIYIYIVLTIIISIITYCIIELILKNDSFDFILERIKKIIF